MLTDVKNFDKVILSKFSKQVDEVRVDEMVRLNSWIARWFAFRTEVVLCTLFSVLLNAA